MNRSPRSNIRRLALGRLISVTGGAAAYIALLYTVWHRTHSATWQSGTLLLTFGVVGIVGPVTGHFGDRFDRRLVMILGEAVAAVFFFPVGSIDRLAALVAVAVASAISESSALAPQLAGSPALALKEHDGARGDHLDAIGRND